MKHFQRVSVALLLCSLLAGCGFKLRGSPALPADIDYIAVQSARPHAPLQRALIKRLDVYGLKGGSTDGAASATNPVIIQLYPEALERRLLSVYPSGQVAEYELIFGVNYTVTFNGEQPVTAYFEVLRDYQDDPDQVLAKSRELDLVLSEMREEAADRILRRLPTQAAALATDND
ncbi:LPS-assembly lipoprotein LptE [Alteromonas sp. CYL-A6]|uniref:LPS-assembly lipoprotein LptE n=1 Tax=Alteromonas nitratireducens TaxID=3390813 RepID=UPI0034B99A87